MKGYDVVPEGAWVAVQVRSNAEKTVAVGLRARNYEEFLPSYGVQRRWSNRRVFLDLPLFRGYVFCRWKRHSPQPIVAVPGVVRIVGIGGTPLPVDDAEVTAVRTIVQSGVPYTPTRLMCVGEHVRLIRGPLRGLEGILINQNKTNSLVVGITLLRRAVAAKVSPWDLVPLEQCTSQSAS